MGRLTEYIHAVNNGFPVDEVPKYSYLTIDAEFRKRIAKDRRELKKNQKELF